MMTPEIKEKHAAVALSLLSRPASADFWRRFERASSASNLAEEIFSRRDNVSIDYVAKAYSSRAVEAASQVIHEASLRSIEIDSFWDEAYPPLLKEISRPPIVLYRVGRPCDSEAVAIVGTRNPDTGGVTMAEKLASDLAGRGCTIVSGMAAGIDRAAHLGALGAGGATAGVTANGLNIMYPTSNRDLYRKVLQDEGSCLLSEYPPKVYGGKFSFVKRNRIISGLSRAAVVVQAPARSGALITAEYALNQNREVFACSGGSFNEAYRGCHRLIQEGAVLVTGAEDILQSFGWEEERNASHEKISLEKRKADRETFRETANLVSGEIRERLTGELLTGKKDIDFLVRKLQISSGEIQEALLCMELEGAITRRGTSVEYIRKSNI